MLRIPLSHLLLVLVLVSRVLGGAAQLSLSRTPLEIVFSENVYNQFGFTKEDISLNRYSHSRMNSVHETSQDTVLPFLACGQLFNEELLQDRLDSIVPVQEHVHIATIDYDSKEICWLIYGSNAQFNELASLRYDFLVQEVPIVTKVLPSTKLFLQEFENLKSVGSPSPAVDNMGVETPRVHDLEGKTIVINIIPNAIDSSNLLHSIIENWKSYHTSSSSRILKVEFVQSHCAMSEATSTEIHSNSIRLNDMRNWELGCIASFIETALSFPSVMSIDVEDRPVLLNYGARGVSQSGTSYFTPFTEAGIVGNGQIAGVTDSGLNDWSCFFYDNTGYYSSSKTTRSSVGNLKLESLRRKVVSYTAYADQNDAVGGHGTHVAGTIVGNSIFERFGAGNGVAPGAKVAFFDVQAGDSPYLLIPDVSTNVFKTLYSAGARVFSNSWGSATSGTYDDRSYQSDYFVYNNQDTLVIYAGGNSGASGMKSLFSPCISKNSICVGSIDLRDDETDESFDIYGNSRVSYFSSIGPSTDGRIKPDVVAPGYKIVSAMAGASNVEKSCGVYETFGTSMAAPVVAGNALLARDYFLNTWKSYCRAAYKYCKSFTPSGYLLKAVLIHSTRAVRSYSQAEFNSKTSVDSFQLNSPPDAFQGYGAAVLGDVLPLDTSKHLYITDAFQVSGYSSYRAVVKITDMSRPLVVTLAWYDLPSSAYSSSGLLQLNLDLVVVPAANQNVAYYGNGKNSKDNLNPVEKVVIANPTSEFYYIYVFNSYRNFAIKAGVVITCGGYVDTDFTQTSSSTSETLNLAASLVNEAAVKEISAETKKLEPLLRVEGTDKDREIVERSTVTRRASIFSGWFGTHTYSIQHTLTPMVPACVAEFSLDDDELIDYVAIQLSPSTTSGSAAFVLGVLLYSPSGEVYQIGGYHQYAATDRLWYRMWPVQWTATYTPPDGGLYWESKRYLNQQTEGQPGKWKLCLQIMHSGWVVTSYSGQLTISVTDVSTQAHSDGSGGYSAADNVVNKLFMVSAIAALCAFVLAVVVVANRNRDAILDSLSVSYNGFNVLWQDENSNNNASKGDATPNINSYKTISKQESKDSKEEAEWKSVSPQDSPNKSTTMKAGVVQQDMLRNMTMLRRPNPSTAKKGPDQMSLVDKDNEVSDSL